METLREIKPGELVAGERLEDDLCDYTGRPLLHAGHRMTVEDLRRLPRRVYVAGRANDPPCETAAEIVGQVFSRLGQNQTATNQRRRERRRWVVPLTIEIEQRGASDLIRSQAKVTTQDISQGGFSFAHRQFVAIGSIVRVRFDILPTKPLLHGVVRNCVLVEGMRHRIGVEFVNEGEEDGPPPPRRSRP